MSGKRARERRKAFLQEHHRIPETVAFESKGGAVSFRNEFSRFLRREKDNRVKVLTDSILIKTSHSLRRLHISGTRRDRLAQANGAAQ